MTTPTSPSDDERVQRLLRDVPPAGPLPEDVSARLDQTLADLQAERPARTGPVTALGASKRRTGRRRLLGGLVAAAVVLVGGGAVVAQLDRGGETMADGSAGSRSTVASADEAPSSGADEDSRLPALTPGPATAELGSRRALPRLSTATFRAGVEDLVAAVPYTAAEPRATAPSERSGLAAAKASDCRVPAAARVAGADVREVVLDGDLATLVVERPANGRPRATAYSCEDAAPRARAVLGR